MFCAMSDSLLNHGAKIVQTEWNVKEKLVFLFISEVPPILDASAKVWRKTIGCFTCRQLVMEMSPTCYISLCISWLQSQILKYKSWWLLYIAEYKEDRWSTILLLAWSCGRIIGAMLGAVKKRAENGIFQWNAKNGVTALQYNNITVLKNQNQNFEPKFYI